METREKGKERKKSTYNNKQDSQNPKKKEEKQKKSSRCPYSRKCGGCQLIDVPYEKQLKEKEKTLKKLLGEFGKIEPIMGMENPDHYRNKVHAVFGIDGRKRPVAGVYEAKSHRVVDVEHCFLENEKATEIIRTIKSLLRSFKIKTYDEDSGYGLLRHVLIRTAKETGQIMVVLVLASPILPSKNNFVKALRKEHPEITTVVLNVNDRATSMVLGEKEQVIYGKGYIEDILCGKRFKISPKSFYQVNPLQTEKLYGTALEFADLTGKETVLDAYCGTGTIGIIAADNAKRVIGVELNKDAVKDADIINTVTPSPVPVLFGKWVKKGAHINAVGACSKTTRELDSECVEKAKLFCDNYDSCRNEAGDYLFPLNEGAIKESHLLGDLAEVISGKVETRTNEDDITIFESQGLACEDVVCAAWLLKQ